MNIHLRDSWDTPCRHLKGTALIESAYQGSPVASLFFLMANGFYVVAVGILHEAAVVVGGILGTETGLAVVLAAGGQSGIVERLHGSAVLGHECNMDRSGRFALGQTQGGRVLGAKDHYSVRVVLHAEAKRRQRGAVEALARVEVLHLKHDVIKHDSLLFPGNPSPLQRHA